MCVYCMIGDNTFRWNPPWPVPADDPFIPQPLTPGPHKPWPTDQLKEYLDLLKQVKELEDKLGCPCEPNKADYIGLFKKRIAALEKKVARKKRARK